MNLNLKNKKVLVTGSTKGIGFTIGENFLKEGAKVAFISRDDKNISKCKLNLKSFNRKDYFVKKCDCLRKNSLVSLRKKLEKEWKILDHLVLNVGDGSIGSRDILDPIKWESSWNINFTSALNSLKIFLPLIKKSKGSIVFISSIAGIEELGAPLAYSTAKSSLVTLAKGLSRKIDSQVRVNVVNPGNIFFKGSIWESKLKKNAKDVKEMIDKKVPLKKFGEPNDVASLVLFLCSDKAKFINGSSINVDGGQTIGFK